MHHTYILLTGENRLLLDQITEWNQQQLVLSYQAESCGPKLYHDATIRHHSVCADWRLSLFFLRFICWLYKQTGRMILAKFYKCAFKGRQASERGCIKNNNNHHFDRLAGELGEALL